MSDDGEVAAIEAPLPEEQPASDALALPSEHSSVGFVAPEAPKVVVPSDLTQLKDESAAWTLANDEQVPRAASGPA